MAFSRLYALTVFFLVIHAGLLQLHIVNGIDAFDRLDSRLTSLNANLESTGSLTPSTPSILDPVTGTIDVLASFVTFIDFIIQLMLDVLDVVIYLFTGIQESMQKILVPNETFAPIIFIVGTFVTIIQLFGVLFFILEVIGKIPR